MNPNTKEMRFLAFFLLSLLLQLNMRAQSIGSSENTQPTSITPHPSSIRKESEDAWFDLCGRKLNGAPAKPGLYINNGKTIVIP